MEPYALRGLSPQDGEPGSSFDQNELGQGAA
jgi:hypothetical protein